MRSGFVSPVVRARNVVENYKLDSLPVNVEKLCDDLDIQVYYVDFSEIEAKVGKKFLEQSKNTVKTMSSSSMKMIRMSESDSQSRMSWGTISSM